MYKFFDSDGSEKDQARTCSSTLVKSVPHNDINQRNVEMEVLTSGEEEVTHDAALSSQNVLNASAASSNLNLSSERKRSEIGIVQKRVNELERTPALKSKTEEYTPKFHPVKYFKKVDNDSEFESLASESDYDVIDASLM